MLIDEQTARGDNLAEFMYRLGNANTENLEDLRRELRLLASDLDLPYRDQALADAVKTWEVSVQLQAKLYMFGEVRFEMALGTGPIGQRTWRDLERAVFDVSETREGSAACVIKKFMWQVKRKALGLAITDHLMPVITGPQGKGKSTFVEKMVGPLHDTMKRVDFKMVTDDRNVSIWSSHILFVDEMGYFSKADVDEIKNVVSAPEVTRRVMRSNDHVTVAQCATFIGCANRSLAELIRDPTGVRRFAELTWKLEPDWNFLNTVDWTMLWQSVDENGPDPSDEIRGFLMAQQEANRAMSSVETWAGAHSHTVISWTGGEALHQAFRNWEVDAFPHPNTSLQAFGREMSRLIREAPEFGWEKRASGKGVAYRGSLTKGTHPLLTRLEL